MEILNSKDLLADALKNGYAIPAFNVGHLEFIKAILEAAENLKSPVIIQAGEKEIGFLGAKNIVDLVKNFGSEKNIKVAIHLDHGSDTKIVKECIEAGFSSLMYDGSMYSLEKNIELTKNIVEIGKLHDIFVEGELGSIGGTSELGEKIFDDTFTDPINAKEFVEKTGVVSLAVGIGNAHGLYKGKPKLHFNILSDIRENTEIPLVLHGGTGIPDEDIKKAISLGISKINVSTQLRKTFLEGILSYTTENKNTTFSLHAVERGYENVKSEVCKIIKIFGSENRI